MFYILMMHVLCVYIYMILSIIYIQHMMSPYLWLLPTKWYPKNTLNNISQPGSARSTGAEIDLGGVDTLPIHHSASHGNLRGSPQEIKAYDGYEPFNMALFPEGVAFRGTLRFPWFIQLPCFFRQECLFEVWWHQEIAKVDVWHFGGPHGNVVPAKQWCKILES